MGFSFRGKGEDRPTEGDVHVVSSGYEGEISAVSADEHIRRLKDQHRFDPFMEDEKLAVIDNAIESGDAEKDAAIESSLIGENSPYPEVRTSVRPPHTSPRYPTPLIVSLGLQHRRP
jgi:hypothetical protein